MKIPIINLTPSEVQVKVNGSYLCGECGERRGDDPRCSVLLKCSICAYGTQGDYDAEYVG